MLSGAFRQRISESWGEIRENSGRSILQMLGVVLGVASVLGGFSISDSMRRRSDDLYVKIGGLDKLNVQPNASVMEGNITALQAANRGLTNEDAKGGTRVGGEGILATAVRKNIKARVRSPWADQDRQIIGGSADFIPMEGFEVEYGRSFSAADLSQAAPVALLGSEAAATFFPSGEVVGQLLRVGDVPTTVIGVFKERVFRFQANGENVFAWRNKFIVLPALLVQRRMEGDSFEKVDRVTFKIPNLQAMTAFSGDLTTLVKANHRLQDDFRLDDVAARVRRARSQGQIYNLVFMLSGILALLGGGLVNVNIQLASLKERIHEVGLKMAIGASGREVFKSFMTEALLLTVLGGAMGMILGVAFSWVITASLDVPLFMQPSSFLWAFVLAGAFGFLFALFPAFKASRLSPMEALHYE
jgi:putative ABC transport system permease protein